MVAIFRKRAWDLGENVATPEAVYLSRRSLVKAIAAGPILAATAGIRSAYSETSPYPVSRDGKYTLDRPITDENLVTTYNNFYEFGSHKRISDAAQAMKISPWQVRFDGMVEKEFTVDFDTLLSAMPLEERTYRHRCVEAWSMAVPWSGFAMAKLVEYAKPLSSAKYIRMQTLADEATMPGLRATWYPWPYTEGLTIEEATNELAFIATGLYGKPIPKQNGAPLRLVTPWKYGFKSIKSLVRFTFTDQRPVSFWEEIQGSEYGFWANVNPEVPHPRWSQATERVLGSDERVPTLLYNGYAEYVAGLYKDMKGERLFM